MERELAGVVTWIDGRTSTVRTEGGVMLRCGLRPSVKEHLGRMRLAVGDHVRVSATGEGDEGWIESVSDRRSALARGRGRGDEQVIAANVDRLAIVTAAAEPGWRPGFVDRLLCAAVKGGLEPVIVVNKIDLIVPASPEDVAIQHDLAVYRRLGYIAIETSAAAGVGLDALRDALRDKVTVFAGQSGVGKSSLTNAVEPGLQLATSEVTKATRKGKHTTTSARLIPLSFGGYVLDTPGVRSFAFYELEEREVGGCFRDIAKLAESCRFRDCLHLDEPDCAVRYAAEEGVMDGRRFDSYRRILASIQLGEDDLR